MKFAAIISLMLIRACLPPFFLPTVADDITACDGREMVIAVLERGFDLSHECFVITNDSPALTEAESDELFKSSHAASSGYDVNSAYVSEKIPFAYDYGDGDTDVSHALLSANGTALISIASGNGKLLEKPNPSAYGTAPEAQVLAMKIYSDEVGDITADAVESAIYDSVLFGADVILIGVNNFPADISAEDAKKVETAIKYADENGVIVVMGVNAVSPYGTGSAYHNNYNLTMPISNCPDISTIAWPASLDSVFAVTSAESNIISSDCFILSDGTRIPYSDTNSEYGPTDGKSFAQYFDNKSFEYVIVSGLGAPEDFDALGDISGKLAVIERGEITFADKAKNAAEHGAAGVIVIDNQSDSSVVPSTRMDLTDAPIPAILISKDSGTLLVESGEHTVSVTTGEQYISKSSDTPTPLLNTARGTSPDMRLKPDISAIGTNVPCAMVDGTYGYFTSTSAAAARVAGMCACVKAKFVEPSGYENPKQLAFLTKASLVNSSEIMRQIAGDAPYSPRVQGGGVASIDNALASRLILTATGSHKIDGGDGYGATVEFNFTLTNLADTKKVCTLDCIAGSDGFTAYTYSDLSTLNGGTSFHEKLGKSPNDTVAFLSDFTAFDKAFITVTGCEYNVNAYSDSSAPLTFTVGAAESLDFSVSIEIDGETYEKYRENFESGFFVEGYVRVTESEDTVSIPFVTYSGDFASSPTLDSEIYSADIAMYDSLYFYRDIGSGAFSILGTESMSLDGIKYNNSLLAFSPTLNRANSKIMLNFGLLRTVYDVTVSVVDSDGEIIKSDSYRELMRTNVSTSSSVPTSARIEVWDGKAFDNPTYIYPDGEYTVSIEYDSAASNERSRIEYTLIIDTEAAELNSFEFEVDGEYTLLKIDAADNKKLSSVSVTDSMKNTASARTDGSFDITLFTGEYIYIELTDIAQNHSVVRIENPRYSSES